MKKLMSLLLALVMMTFCCAMAETADVPATQTLVSPDGTYSFEVPADYIPMNSETILQLFSTEAMQDLLAQMMGLEDGSQLSVYFEQLEQSNMMLVYSSTLIGNLNVQAVTSALTMDQIVMLKSMLDASLIQQYVSLGVAEEDIQTMDIQEIAGRRWYAMKLMMMGMEVQTMITEENGIQYTMTFTGIAAEEMQGILESFTVVPAVE